MTTPEGDGLHFPMANRLPVGDGSRGGRWHEREYRNEYQRAWRAAHPEYRERERLRRARERARVAGTDPADIVEPATFPRPLPVPAARCSCPCGCGEHVVVVCGCGEHVVVVCGFCQQGIHENAS